MEAMTEQEWRGFVLAGTRTGKLAVTRADGRPHVTPVWFLLDEREGACEVVFTTWHASVKARVLRRDGRFSLCVDDQEPPCAYVMLECTAELTEDPDELRTWATRIGARYMGADRAQEYGARNCVPGEYLVRAVVHKAVAHRGVAD